MEVVEAEIQALIQFGINHKFMTMRTDRSNNPIANKAYPVVLAKLDSLGYKKDVDYTIGDSTAGIDTDATSTIKYANPTVGFKASADLLKGGQIASWYGNAKYGGAGSIHSTLSQLSGKKVDYNNAQSIYNSLDPEKQKAVVKAIYKHEGGSGILSTFENFNEKIDKSRAAGYSDTQILDNLGKISPDLKTKVEKSRALIGKDPMINNDNDILARLSQKYAGTVPSSTPKPISATQEQNQKKQDIAAKNGMVLNPTTGAVEQPKEQSGVQKAIGGLGNWFNKAIIDPAKGYAKDLQDIAGRATTAGALNLNPVKGQTLPETALQATGAGVKALFTPIAETVKSLYEASSFKKGMSDLATLNPKAVAEKEKERNQAMEVLSKGFSAYSEFAQKNPRLAANINATVDVGTLFLGGSGKTLTSIEKDIVANEAKAAIPKEVETVVGKDFLKAVKPSTANIRYAGGIQGYVSKASEALHDILSNFSKLNIVNKETGEVVTKLSKMPSVVDGTVQAVDNGKKLVFDAYDNLQRSAGNNVKVDLGKVADEMTAFVKDNKVLKTEYPEVYQKFLQEADNLRNSGSYSLQEAQESLKKANEALQNFYRTGNGGADAQIKAFVSSRLRTSMDELISGETDMSYQALKNKYGNFKAIEKDVMNMALKEAKKAPKGLYDVFGDMAASGEMLRGLVTLNPGSIASSFGIKAVQQFYKNLNSPDAILRGMFKTLEKKIPEADVTSITQALGAKEKPLLQLPEPKPGASKVSIETPINLPAKAPSTIEKGEIQKFGGKKTAEPVSILGLPAPKNVIELPSKGILEGQSKIK